MADILYLDPAARADAGSFQACALDSHLGDGPAPDGAGFQDMLAEVMHAKGGGNGTSDPAASASAGSAPAEVIPSASAPDAGSTAPPQAGNGKPAAFGALGEAWDWTRQQAGAASQAIGDFDAAHGHALTRSAGAAQAVGAVAEGLTGAAVAGVGGAATATGAGAAPGIPAMIGGGALMANALDNGVAGVRTAWSGEFHHTLTSQAAGAGARALGASDRAAGRITAGVDLAQGIAGGGASIAAGVARRGAVRGMEAAANEAGHAAMVTKGGAQTDLVDELVKNGTKITPADVVGTTRMPGGQIAFLERGNSSSGLQHIIERHGAEFAQAGIPESKMPAFLMEALENGKLVGQQGRRPVYEVNYEGNTLQVAITMGNNGYVVGANMR